MKKPPDVGRLFHAGNARNSERQHLLRRVVDLAGLDGQPGPRPGEQRTVRRAYVPEEAGTPGKAHVLPPNGERRAAGPSARRTAVSLGVRMTRSVAIAHERGARHDEGHLRAEGGRAPFIACCPMMRRGPSVLIVIATPTCSYLRDVLKTKRTLFGKRTQGMPAAHEKHVTGFEKSVCS